MLTDYERELIGKKLEKSRLEDAKPELDLSKYKMNEKGDMIYITGEDVSPVEKGAFVCLRQRKCFVYIKLPSLLNTSTHCSASLK